jgi:SpoVK/Ycf46/Vps4 family AAA+-type ATPase
MPSPQQPAVPGRPVTRNGLTRVRQAVTSAPVPVRILLVALVIIFAVPLVSVALIVALGYAPYGLATRQRSVLASVCVAVWGIVVIVALAHGAAEPRYLLLLLPVAVVVLSHLGVLGRWPVPCRTAAWALLWSLPVGIAAIRVWHSQPLLGPAMAWPIALVVVGWRFVKALQDSRQYGRVTDGIAVPAPYSLAAVGPAAGAVPVSPAGRSELAGDASLARAAQPTAVSRSAGSGRPAGRAVAQPDAEWTHITVDAAMAELTAMVGLAAVKAQVRSITASVEAARRRAIAGHAAEKPMQHFVFLGPPGTGKTAVARVVAKIFYAFGLLDSPTVVEAHRADLVGEYLGATAIRTNDLIDSALGKVLFIDEAYSLVNDGDGQVDRFGNEAVQALVKRAEDDRERLIIILAGYERQMESFLAANPGLNSRFGVRVKFPTYSATELQALAEASVQDRGELLDPDAGPALREMLEEVTRRRLTDELGNGRFVRNLLAKAGQQRDVRVMGGGAEPTPADLVTLRAEDLRLGYAELTTRFRGYTDTPTVESALAELDALVGLEPVKRQVHEIVAQLQVARLRDRQGLASQPPSRHFVFTGPPGTGKTTVARILGRIFAALGLLVRPEVIEAHRADLVGEHLGSTAIKTSRLIDSALGGVLFVDEAYALHNQAYSGGDAFGSEAVATLLKRAEDDRDRLVIVLAGYTADMDRLLRSNPGLASRFSTRIAFPSYTAAELGEITRSIAAQAGDRFDPGALPVLESIFGHAVQAGRIDALGNGRFARTLFERACASRDVRVSLHGEAATAAELTTLLGADVRAAYLELAG